MSNYQWSHDALGKGKSKGLVKFWAVHPRCGWYTAPSEEWSVFTNPFDCGNEKDREHILFPNKQIISTSMNTNYSVDTNMEL